MNNRIHIDFPWYRSSWPKYLQIFESWNPKETDIKLRKRNFHHICKLLDISSTIPLPDTFFGKPLNFMIRSIISAQRIFPKGYEHLNH
jgi:hypothetical protein